MQLLRVNIISTLISSVSAHFCIMPFSTLACSWLSSHMAILIFPLPPVPGLQITVPISKYILKPVGLQGIIYSTVPAHSTVHNTSLLHRPPARHASPFVPVPPYGKPQCRLIYLVFRYRIQCRRRFIQYDKGCVLIQSPGQSNFLRLAS